MLHPILTPVLHPLLGSVLNRRFRQTDIVRAIFADASPGWHWVVEEAVKANKAAGVWGVTSGWTAPQLALCQAFQDSGGTIPVYAVEQPIGLILDTSRGLVRGVERLTNGDFSSGSSGWSVTGNDATHIATFIGGTLRYQSDTTTPAMVVSQTGVLEVGRLYEIEFDVSAYVGGQLKSDSFNGLSIPTGTGKKTVTGIATATTFWIARATTNVDITIDSVSVKEIYGNHFYQSDPTKRPTVSARLNLFTATDTLATQSVTALAAGHVLSFTGAGSVTLSGAATGVYTAGTHSITATAGSLTATVSGVVTNADLRLAIDVTGTLPPYQRVTSASDYDTVGFQHYAKTNGLNTFLEPAPVDFTGVDEVTAVVGMVRLGDAAESVVLEFGANSATTAGSFGVFARGASGTAPAARSRGSVASVAQGGSTSPSKAVMSMTAKVATDALVLRENGVQVATSATDQGTGNMGNHKAYVGMRAGTSLPFNGRIYGMTVVGKLQPDSRLLALEARQKPK